MYPANRNSFAALGDVLVDRATLCRAILAPLGAIDRRANQPWAGYVIALQTLKSMFESGKKSERLLESLKSDPALGHPRLNEIFPYDLATSDQAHSYESHFLRRFRRYAHSRSKDRNRESVSPVRTPFYLLGLPQEVRSVRSLSRYGADPGKLRRWPDVVLLDLTAKRRRSFGNGWRSSVQELLDALIEVYVDKAPPVLAVTDDPFVLQELRFHTLRDYESLRDTEYSVKRAPVDARFALNLSSNVISPEVAIPTFIATVDCHVFGTDGLRVVEEGLTIRRHLIAGGQLELADAIANCCNVLRRLLSLPGDPRSFHDFIRSRPEDLRLARAASKFDRFAARNRVESTLNDCGGGDPNGDIATFLKHFDQVVASLEKSHPGGAKFDQLLRKSPATHVPAIIILPTLQSAEFARWRLENDPFLWDVRMQTKSFCLLTPEEQDLGSTAGIERADSTQAIFFEPQVDTLLRALCWLPLQSVNLVANHASVSQLVRRLKIICDVAGDHPVCQSLRPIEKELQQSITSHLVDIDDLDSEPSRSRSDVEDLSDRYSGAGALHSRVLTLSGGSRIKVFDGSEIPCKTASALWHWSKTLARDLRAGDEICIFRDELVTVARLRLEVSTDATSLLETYHRTVLDARDRIPGQTLNERAEILWERMKHGIPEPDFPSLATVKRWLDVDNLLKLSRAEVRPHAPGKKEHYDLLMRALKVPEDLGNLLWEEGVFGTRSKRIRHGNFLHQLMMAVLVDPDAVRSRLPKLTHNDLWEISEYAAQFTEIVVSNEAL